MSPSTSIVVKLSGAAFADTSPLDGRAFELAAEELAYLAKAGMRVGVVVGGGNIMRGGRPWGDHGISRTAQDDLGMLATAINAIALRSEIQQRYDIDVKVIAKPGICAPLCEPWEEASLGAGGAGDITVVAGGVGRSGVSTDVAAPILARAMGARRIVMSKHGIDGIYATDPNEACNSGRRPTLLRRLTGRNALDLDLRFMDRTAIQICSELSIEVHVIGAHVLGGIRRAAMGESLGSVMTP